LKEKKIISSRELMSKLVNEKGLGREAARKKLHFLHHIDKRKNISRFGCRYIDIVRNLSMHSFAPEAVIFFRNKNRVFFSKDVSREEIYDVVEALLSDVQKDILEIMRSKVFSTGYFSSYEIKKLTPERGDVVSKGVNRLLEIGFLKRHKISSRLPRLAFGRGRKYLDFYTTIENAALFLSQKVDAVIDEVTEIGVLRHIQRLFMDTKDGLHVRSFKGTMRPKEKRLVGQVRGMSFDIVLPLQKRYDDKRFLAIDVYTRFPVTSEVINRFSEKIEKSKTAAGIIFARVDLNDENIANYSADHVTIVILEHVESDRRPSKSYREIRERIASLQNTRA